MFNDNRTGWVVKQSFNKDFVDCMGKLYDKYGEEIFAIQGIANKNMDIARFSKTFFNNSSSVADVSVDGNANVKEKNVIQYNYENNKALMKLNSLYIMYKWVKKYNSKQDADLALEKVVSGEIFVSDLFNFTLPYCYAFDLNTLLEEGMTFFKGGMKIKAPKRSESFIALLIQAVAYMSNQLAGAVSFPSFFVSLNYFYEKEMGVDYINKLKSDSSLDFKIKNQFQNLIYSLNFPFRGSQSAFTNLSIMDMGFLKELFSEYSLPDGSYPNLDNVLELSKLFFEYHTSINCKEGIFTFPILTLATSLDENKEYLDPSFKDWISEQNSSKSLSNVYIGPPDSFASCCRLRNTYNKAAGVGYTNTLGVGGLSIGSHRIVGYNLPRIALLEKENPNIFKEDLDIIHKILHAHRKLIEDRVKGGFLPLYNTGWISLSRQYSTVGFVGAYEYLKNKDLDIKTEEGLDYLISKLQIVEDNIKIWQEDEGYIYNMEQIPAETMAVRLAEIDNLLGYNDKYELYSNQYIPLIEDAAIYDRFKIQGKLDSLTTGGAILHINIDDEVVLTPEQYGKLIDTAKQTGTVYFAVNYCYSECKEGHFVVGKKDICPICNSKIIDYFTRVVGFITPKKAWTAKRRDYEFKGRKWYKNNFND